MSKALTDLLAKVEAGAWPEDWREVTRAISLHPDDRRTKQSTENMKEDGQLKSVCKIGQGADCCRYLMGSPADFQCAKTNGMRASIDARADKMKSKGDNCPGMFSIKDWDQTNV